MHEAKWDGWRLQIIKIGGDVRLFTRSGAEWTKRAPILVAAFAELRAKTMQLDGEVCLCDERGRPDFYRLQKVMRSGGPASADLSFYAFDLLHLNGVDWKAKPLRERRERLADLQHGADVPQFYLPDAFEDGAKLLASCERIGLEGIVSKRVDRPYMSGSTMDWRKVKCQAWCEANRDRWEMFEKK
jgi:bifunctional non-homologous end joining protein LigD